MHCRFKLMPSLCKSEQTCPCSLGCRLSPGGLQGCLGLGTQPWRVLLVGTPLPAPWGWGECRERKGRTEDTFILGPTMQFQGHVLAHSVSGGQSLLSHPHQHGELQGASVTWRMNSWMKGARLKPGLQSCRNGFGVGLVGPRVTPGLPPLTSFFSSEGPFSQFTHPTNGSNWAPSVCLVLQTQPAPCQPRGV